MLIDGKRLILELQAVVSGGGSNVVVTSAQEGTTDSHLTVETTSAAFSNIFVRQDGSQSLTGNWDQGNFNLTSVTSWFLGIVQASKVFGLTDFIWNIAGNGTLLFTSDWNATNTSYALQGDLINGTFTNTNAETECSGALYLAGNGTCTADLDTTIANTDAESKCAGALYLAGNGTCTAELDTTYSASGILLDLTSTTFSINEGTLTDERICEYESTGTQLECTLVKDGSGACASGAVCLGDHTHAASQVTAGTFAAGNYVMPTNLTVERIVLEGSGSLRIEDNVTCVNIFGSTSVIRVC